MKRTDSPILNEEQVQLIRDHILKGAPDHEIQRFIITCERTGLDPFSRQLYGNLQNKKIKVGNRDEWIKTVVIITSIDGFRAIAERSGEYRGQTPPEWYYVDDNGKAGWHDVFITARNRNGDPLTIPDACRVGVIREGFKDPCYGVANFSSFAKYRKGGDGEDAGYVLDTFWKKMPEHMIAKVAEAQAHRKAFPMLACGLYVEEEVRNDDEETPETATVEKTVDTLPAGATFVETIKKAPPAHPVETPEPSAPVVEEKPATAKPEKKAKAKQETPKEPAITIVSESGVTAEEIPLTKEASDKYGWENHKIEQITVPAFRGKTLGQLSFEDIDKIYTGWVLKYATNIASNPAKVIEAAAITAAYNATR